MVWQVEVLGVQTVTLTHGLLMYPMDVLGEQREPFTVTSSTLFPVGGVGDGTYTMKLPVSTFERSPEASVTKIWKEEAPGAVVV